MSQLRGTAVGFETLLALMGLWEERSVKKNMSSAATLDINPVAERDQTTIQVAGLGLGRTGSTSLVVALEILGYLGGARRRADRDDRPVRRRRGGRDRHERDERDPGQAGVQRHLQDGQLRLGRAPSRDPGDFNGARQAGGLRGELARGLPLRQTPRAGALPLDEDHPGAHARLLGGVPGRDHGRRAQKLPRPGHAAGHVRQLQQQGAGGDPGGASLNLQREAGVGAAVRLPRPSGAGGHPVSARAHPRQAAGGDVLSGARHLDLAAGAPVAARCAAPARGWRAAGRRGAVPTTRERRRRSRSRSGSGGGRKGMGGGPRRRGARR